MDYAIGIDIGSTCAKTAVLAADGSFALLSARPTGWSSVDTAESIRPGTKNQCFSGTLEEISITKNTQPCLFCVDLAAAEALREAGITPDMTAGFSLGEVAAVTFAGIFTTEEGFSLVTKRGEAMQAAAEQADSAMAAVLKPRRLSCSIPSPGQSPVNVHGI